MKDLNKIVTTADLKAVKEELRGEIKDTQKDAKSFRSSLLYYIAISEIAPLIAAGYFWTTKDISAAISAYVGGKLLAGFAYGAVYLMLGLPELFSKS